MKHHLCLSLFMLVAILSSSQWNWGVDFEYPYYLERIEIDTVSNPNCTWQIGQPSKSVFTSSLSAPNAIVTDTINPVPANDTSIFYLRHVRDNSGGMLFHVFVLNFKYQMDGDSTDFGTIEISPDTGNTWVNLLTQDITYDIWWVYPKPTLRGSTDGWQSFSLNMYMWATDESGNYPVMMTADTILFRFTYVSDSSSVERDGWIIDEFELEDSWEGIGDIHDDNLISVFPNPTSNEFFARRNVSDDLSNIQIIDSKGQLLLERSNYYGYSIDSSDFPNGIYTLRYSDSKGVAFKKFVVQH